MRSKATAKNSRALAAKGRRGNRFSERGGRRVFKTDTASARLTFEKNAQQAVNAVSILDGVSPPEKGLPKMLLGRTPVTLEQYEKTAEAAPVHAKTASRILALDKKDFRRNRRNSTVGKPTGRTDPWLSLDISMRTLGTGSTNVFIGSFPEELTEADLKNKLASSLPEADGIELEIISSQSQQTCVFLVCHSKLGMQVESLLRSMGFTYPAAPSNVLRRAQRNSGRELPKRKKTAQGQKQRSLN